MKNFKVKLLYVLCIILLVLFPVTSFAHSGRTDSSGGHRDNQNRSGLGSYHYHCGGYPPHLHPNGVCPYQSGGSSQPSSNRSTPSPQISLKSYPNVLKVGESSGLEYSISNTSNKKSKIKSSNSKVVKVNSDGTLTGVGAGTAQITISASNVTKSFTVQVKTVPVGSVKITNKIDKIQLGKTYQFQTSVSPKNATNKNVSWTSNNQNILEVSNNGKIKTKAAGTATITCVSVNNVKAKIKIKVYEVVPEEIKSEDSIKLNVGDTHKLPVEILPQDSNKKDFLVSCQDEDILKYSDSSIQALKEGETTLCIETWNGVKQEIPVQIDAIPVKNIKINDTTEYIYSNFINKSDKILIDVEISPQNATYQDVIWNSSNKNVVDIENNDFIIKDTGKVTLTCIANDGNVKNSVDIVIINKDFIIGISLLMMVILLIVIISIIKIKNKRKQAL